MAAPNVAVITVSYNSSGQLTNFLDSVHDQFISAIYIVDNASGSDDLANTQKIAAAYNATLIELPVNKGYGTAVNSAVAVLAEPVDTILISNPDVSLAENALATMLVELNSDPRNGAVGPRILNTDGTTYPSARELPSIRTGIGHTLFVRIWPANPWTKRYHAERMPATKARDAGWLSGACMLVRRQTFQEIGGFDEGYFMYFEDVDLGHRLAKAGWRTRYEPAAIVTHVGAASTRTESGTMLRAHHESAVRYLGVRYPGLLWAPIRIPLQIGLKLRGFWLTRHM